MMVCTCVCTCGTNRYNDHPCMGRPWVHEHIEGRAHIQTHLHRATSERVTGSGWGVGAVGTIDCVSGSAL